MSDPIAYAAAVVVLDPDGSVSRQELALEAARAVWPPATITRGQGWATIALGDRGDVGEAARLETLPGVRRVAFVDTPYRLASRQVFDRSVAVRLWPAGSSVDHPGAAVGGDGPVTAFVRLVGSVDRFSSLARAVSRAGAVVMMSGEVTAPSGSTSSREQAACVAAAQALGMPLCVEVSDADQVPSVRIVGAAIEVGSRNMQHFHLLRHLGDCPLPVLLRRGAGATIEEFLLAAEYILANGNGQVILCESGIRTFDAVSGTRFEISAIPVLRLATHLPVMADPSAATPHPRLVPAVARAAVAAGADGLVLTVGEIDDDRAIGVQTFSRLLDDVRRLAASIGRVV
jgi:3-deoxy-7-phosphoheptulonate synthase